MTTKYVQAPEATLQSSISSSATSCVLTGFVDLSGLPLLQTDFGDLGYGTFEPNTAREEAVSFVITSNPSGEATLTITRGLRGKAPYGTGGTGFAHNAGAKFVVSNNPDLLNKFTAKDNDEVVTGSWEFPDAVDDNNPLTKGQFDDAAVKLTGAQDIAGVKTFTDSPIVPAAVADEEAVNKAQMEAYADSLNADNVKITGNQTIDGVKTFSSSPVVPDATNSNQPLTKGQFDSATQAAISVASPSVRGAAKIDTAADTPADPVALTATAARIAALLAGGEFGTIGTNNKFVTEDFLRYRESLTTFDSFSVTAPTPVFVNGDGTLLRSSAAASSGRQKFHGFVQNINTSALLPRFLDGVESPSNTFSLTVPAGTNRYLLVFSYQTGSGVVQPTAMTWNGNALSRLTTGGTPSSFVEVWGLALGTGATVTANVVVSSAAGSFVSHQAVVYEHIHQTSGIADTDDAATTSVTTLSTPSLTAVDPFSLFVYGGTSSVDVTLAISGTTNRLNSSQTPNRARTGDFTLIGSSVATVTTAVNNTIAVAGVVLRAAAAVTSVLRLDRVVDGFTGLTPGANYFVSNTTGTISTTPGTLSIAVGIALTATKIYVNL